MKITEDPEFAKEVLDKIAKREFYERTGIHGSDLIFCLNKQALRQLQPKESTPEEILIFSLGWASQRWLTGSFEPDTELEVDGIKVTPDFFSGGIPWELKATYQASTRPVEDSLHWIRQIEAQCYVTGTVTANLTRLEFMGDWGWVYPKGSTPEEKKAHKLASKHPTMSAWKLEFTQEELGKFWKWMLERKEIYEGILETGELVPKAIALASGMTWECGRCSYKGECEGK